MSSEKYLERRCMYPGLSIGISSKTILSRVTINNPLCQHQRLCHSEVFLSQVKMLQGTLFHTINLFYIRLCSVILIKVLVLKVSDHIQSWRM